MFCRKCGKKLLPGSNSCDKCGTKVAANGLTLVFMVIMILWVWAVVAMFMDLLVEGHWFVGISYMLCRVVIACFAANGAYDKPNTRHYIGQFLLAIIPVVAWYVCWNAAKYIAHRFVNRNAST